MPDMSLSSKRRTMKIRDITFLALGIAMFVALSMCLRVPVFDNYYLCLGYIVMTVIYGAFSGTRVPSSESSVSSCTAP